MRQLRIITMGALLLAATLASGCDERPAIHYGRRDRHVRRGAPRPPAQARTVELVFVNNSPVRRTVVLTVRGQRVNAGRVPPRGGRLRYKLLVPRGALPAKVRWTAGAFDGGFLLTRHGPKRKLIGFGHPPLVRPRPVVRRAPRHEVRHKPRAHVKPRPPLRAAARVKPAPRPRPKANPKPHLKRKPPLRPATRAKHAPRPRPKANPKPPRNLRLLFVNRAKFPRTVYVTLPNGRGAALGRVAPNGGKLDRIVTLPREKLPARITWRANRLSGSFVVTARGARGRKIILRNTAPPRRTNKALKGKPKRKPKPKRKR